MGLLLHSDKEIIDSRFGHKWLKSTKMNVDSVLRYPSENISQELPRLNIYKYSGRTQVLVHRPTNEWPSGSRGETMGTACEWYPPGTAAVTGWKNSPPHNDIVS